MVQLSWPCFYTYVRFEGSCVLALIVCETIPEKNNLRTRPFDATNSQREEKIKALLFTFFDKYIILVAATGYMNKDMTLIKYYI